MLSIAYFTSRKNPLIEMFFDSLDRELAGDYTDKRIIVVDFWAEDDGRAEYVRSKANDDQRKVLVHVPPKPSRFQGKHRVTKDHWWDAASARNTALCLAPDGFLAYFDDLSVLLPGYGKQLRLAMTKPGVITLGAYQKVKNLNVVKGDIISFEKFDGGMDHRYGYGRDHDPLPCSGQWLYGCSLVGNTEAFLITGGWPEAISQSLSMEDVLQGLMSEKMGYRFQYDRSMMTYESEEHHHSDFVIRRSDFGVSPNDKSHAALRIIQQGSGFHPNYFGEEGIRGLRKRILAGEPFPVPQIPCHEWWTGKPLEEL